MISTKIVTELKVLAVDKINNGKTDMEVGEGLGIKYALGFLNNDQDNYMAICNRLWVYRIFTAILAFMFGYLAGYLVRYLIG